MLKKTKRHPAILCHSDQNLLPKEYQPLGKFYGRGVQIEGKVMNQYPGGIRIFVSDPIGGKNFVVTEFYYAEDIEAYMRGMGMIQETLKKSS